MAQDPVLPELSPMERAALALTRFANERPLPKRLQHAFCGNVTLPWVRASLARRVYTDGLDNLLELYPDRGVLLCANHRSFFDMYTAMLALFMRDCGWLRRLYFPVRSNFFYETTAGVLMNFAVGGGAMYPPIFRERTKSPYNDDALERLKRFLRDPDVIVGMHPEGTRNKGANPYALLPAQPGVGEVVLQAKPIVIPMFINGLTNDFVGGIRTTHRPGSRRTDPILLVIGKPFDYSAFADKKPRLALYKRVADQINDAIAALGGRERELRAAIASGAIPDDAPSWLVPPKRSRRNGVRRNGVRRNGVRRNGG